MSDESIQASAETLRADFLNATTTHARWRVLNRALQWALDASENAEFLRRQRAAAQTVTLKVDATDARDDVAEMERQLADLEARAAVLELCKPDVSTRVWKDGYVQGAVDSAALARGFDTHSVLAKNVGLAISVEILTWAEDVRTGKETPW